MRSFKISILYALCLIIPSLLAGCVDDLLSDGRPSEYPEGDTDVRFVIDFEPFSGNKVATRGLNGKTMDALDDLCIVAYDESGNLMEGFPVQITRESHGLTLSHPDRTSGNASNGHLAEKSTTRGEFKLRIPYGLYYIYAVANLGKRDKKGNLLSTTADALSQGALAEAVKSREDFLNYKTSWDTENPYQNFEMLGYFCKHLSEDDKSPSTGETANDFKVSIDNPNMEIHSWLRRCASKVTIDFDGSGLRDNIRIHIKRATIHDVPAWCRLGKPNRPADRSSDIIPFKDGAFGTEGYRPNGAGDQIVYSEGDDYRAWGYVAKGHPKLSDTNYHAEDAESLFLYENMQGNTENDKRNKEQLYTPDGLVVGADEEKDLVPCGSYIEVEGYYENISNEEVSKGKIFYRFMLGKDELKNFDVERNYHIQLTLNIRGNGNDVDWHIEYNREEEWEWSDPYHCSYLYNQSSTIHFRYTPPSGVKVDSLQAEIVANNWWADFYDEAGTLDGAVETQRPWPTDADEADPYNFDYEKSTHNRYPAGHVLAGRRKYLGNGWLSLRWNNKMNIDGTEVIEGYDKNHWTETPENVSMNDYYFYGKSKGAPHDCSRRSYYFTDGSGNNDPTDKEHYNFEEINGSYRFNIPVFTRAKNLVKQTAYSGNNPYEGSPRSAFVQFKIFLNNGEIRKQVMRVRQEWRLTNPKGIYRKSRNFEGFDVELVNRPKPSSPDFQTFESDGPWIAEVIGDQNFITLNGRSTISGSTGSPIAFHVGFNRINNDDKVRNAGIRIRYHNMTCVHLIFVRQGYDAQQIQKGGAFWHTTNYINVDGNLTASDPRDEGSMFKYGNLSNAIDVASNYNPWTEPTLPLHSDFKNAAAMGDLILVDSKGKIDQNKRVSWSSFNGDASNVAAMQKAKTAKIEHFRQLFPTNLTQHAFGVLYADGATKVQKTIAGAFGYNRHDKGTEQRGIRGLFVYHWNGGLEKDEFNAKNVFFPIGRSGFGQRRSNDAGNGVANSIDGTLRYSAGRNGEMPGSAAIFQPLFFDLYRRQGALYWSDEMKNVEDVTGVSMDAWALDINYYTFDVNTIEKNSLQKHSQWSGCAHPQCINACFLRAAEDPSSYKPARRRSANNRKSATRRR